MFRKKTITLTILCAVVSAGLFLMVNSIAAQSEAVDVIDRYMSAVFSGNIEIIKQCLGKDLQQGRKNTFKDPTYSDFLINRYDGATYQVVQNRELKSGSKSVDVKITFQNNSKMIIRLILDRNNKIIDEAIL